MSIRSENPPGNRSVGDPFNRAFPIGIGARRTDEIALDLEASPACAAPADVKIDPASSTAPGDGRCERRWREPLGRGRELDAALRTGIER